MPIRSGLSEILSNPLVQFTLAAKGAGMLAGAYNEAQQGQDESLINQSLAQGEAIRTRPTPGLIGSFSRLVGHPMTSDVDPGLLAREQLVVQKKQEDALQLYAKLPPEMRANRKLSDFFAHSSGLPAEYFPAAASGKLTQLGINAGLNPQDAAMMDDKAIQDYLTAYEKTPKGKAEAMVATENARLGVRTSPAGLAADSAEAGARARAGLAPDIVAAREAEAGGMAAAGARGRIGVESSPMGLAALRAETMARTKPPAPKLIRTGDSLTEVSFDANGNPVVKKVMDIPKSVKNATEFSTFAEGYRTTHPDASGDQVVTAYKKAGHEPTTKEQDIKDRMDRTGETREQAEEGLAKGLADARRAPKEASSTEKDITDWMDRNPGKTRQDAREALTKGLAGMRASAIAAKAWSTQDALNARTKALGQAKTELQTSGWFGTKQAEGPLIQQRSAKILFFEGLDSFGARLPDGATFKDPATGKTVTWRTPSASR